MSIVRRNLMEVKDYTPYCGNVRLCFGMWPRTKFNGRQFECPSCGWKSQLEKDFIDQYKEKWRKHENN